MSGRSSGALSFGRDKVLDDSFAAMSSERPPARLGQEQPATGDRM